MMIYIVELIQIFAKYVVTIHNNVPQTRSSAATLSLQGVIKLNIVPCNVPYVANPYNPP